MKTTETEGTTTMSTVQEIVRDIVAYVGNDKYPGWYAGIAAAPRDRLFDAHRVDEQKGRWIFRTATSNANARIAEAALHKLGFDGGPGGGDSGTRAVYAYKITATTIE